MKSSFKMVNFYCNFVSKAVKILYPLFQLLKKDAKLHWDYNCVSALKKMTDILASPQVLTQKDSTIPIKQTEKRLQRWPYFPMSCQYDLQYSWQWKIKCNYQNHIFI